MASQKPPKSSTRTKHTATNEAIPPDLPGDPAARLDQKRWRRGVLAVCVLSILVFIHGLANQLVWDDQMLIGGSAIGGGNSLWKCFTEPFLENFFRPLVSVWFFFERYLWNRYSIGYHATGLLIHALTTWVVACLLRRVLPSDRAALIGAAAFAIHPSQVGSVAWTGGRTDTLVVLWISLFLLHAVKAVQESPFSPKRVMIATLFYALAVFTKEQALPMALAGPLAALWLAPGQPLAEGGAEPEAGERSSQKGLAFLLAVPPILVAVVFLVIGSRLHLPRPNFALLDPSLHAITFLRTVAYYTLLEAIPLPPWMFAMSLGPVVRLGIVGLVIGAASIILCIGLLAACSKRAPNLAWLLSISLLVLIPVSGILPMPFLQVASYRACLASIGFAGIAGYLFSEWLPNRLGDPGLRGSARLAMGAFALWWIGLTIWGTAVWRTQHGFFVASASLDPDSVVAHHLVAYQFGEEKQWAKCVAEYEVCLRLIYQSARWDNPVSAGEQFHNDAALRRRVLQNQGNREDPPTLWLAMIFTKMGSSRIWAGDKEGGARAYEAGVTVDPVNVEALYGVGYAAYFQGNMPRAAEYLGRSIQCGSKNTDLRMYLARALAWLGRWQEAVQPAQEWLNADPGNVDAYLILSRAQIETKSYFQAITTLTKASGKFPDDSRIPALMQEATRRSTESAMPPGGQ